MGYPTKVQLISRQKGQQWYVNFPNALAEAMNFKKGETVEWTILSTTCLQMQRRLRQSQSRKGAR
jgi:antitoxin component of MazEF toxin-antitoxin module